MSAPLASRIDKRNAARVAKMASSQARAFVYYTAHGDEVKAEAAAAWLAEHVRCRVCGRALTASADKGIGPECAKRSAA